MPTLLAYKFAIRVPFTFPTIGANLSSTEINHKVLVSKELQSEPRITLREHFKPQIGFRQVKSVSSYPVRLAYLGVGGYGGAPLQASAQSDMVKIGGVCDLNREVAESQAARYQCEVWDSFEQILEDDAVGGVVMTLPPDENLRYVQQTAAAGKHCFVAKPIATTTADARAMQQACQDAGVVLMVGHNDRRRAEVREAKRLIEEGKIGQPVLFEGHFSHMGGWGLTAAEWRAQRDRCPVVALMMLGVHAIDSMIYLLGPATVVKAFHRHAAMPVDNEDVAVQIFELEGGALGYVGDSYCSPHTHYYRVLGTEGSLYVEYEKLTLIDAKTNPQEVDCPPTNPEVELVEEFARGIVEGIEIETDGEESIKALACVEGAIKSARDGCEVMIADLL